jgi:hypothetical protein
LALEYDPEFMTSQSKEFTRKRSTIWIVTIVFLFVLGLRALVMATQYFREPRIVRDLCSVQQFEQDLIPNSANTRLVFCQDTVEGVGIYFYDTAGGKPRLLCEQKEKGHSWKRFTMLGWAPDDSLFACAFPENKQDQELILIFDGRTGELLDKVVADQSFNQFGWLSNDSFAYSTHTSVRVVTRQANGSWVHKRNFENVATNMDNFTTVSANSVAWQDDGGICLFDLDSGSSDKIWEATTNRLVEFTHAKGVNEFLLNCSDDAGQYLLWFNPQDKRTFNLGRISGHQDYIRKALWTGHGTSYAYLTNDLAGSAFCIKTEEMATPITIPWHGGVHNVTLSGGQLFFSGNPDDQPPGIWEYDIKSQTFNCIVPSKSGPLMSGLGVSPSCGVMTNSLGEQRFYHLWAPPHVSPNKKYPVLLVQELNLWYPYFQIAANSGFYVAVVDRPFFHTWNGIYERTWVEDISSIYEIAAHNSHIDTNRVYLHAISAETSYLSRLINERPTLAKGAILFSPTGLPDPSKLQNKHILIVDGKTDGNAMKRLPEFQDRSAEQGNAITLFLQDYAGHIPASGTTERNRARQFAKFILDHQ